MKFIIISSIILLVACSESKTKENVSAEKINTQQVDSVVTKSDTININSNQYYTVSDVNCDALKGIKTDNSTFIPDTLRFKKTKGKIHLPLSKGKTLVLSDTLTSDESSDESVEYKYLGYFPAIKFYLVQEILWEEIYYYLIDISTGTKTFITGIPKLSPNNEYLINENEMGGFGDNQFGLEIWKFDKSKRSLTLIPTLQQDEWHPISFTWINGNTLVLKAIPISSKDFGQKSQENSQDCVCKKIEFK